MERVATSRLIDASATLDAADRALLNLWVNRGLPDSALAQMTGLGPEAIAARRAGIVEQLSERLGRPPDEVREALAEIATANPEPSGNGATGAEAAPAEPPPATEPEPPPAPEESPPATEPPPAAGPDRKLLLRAAGAALALVIVAVVLVIALAGGSSPPKAKLRPAAARTTTAAPPAPVAQTSPRPSPTVSRPPVAPAALPGGVLHARGSVFLSGNGKRRRLKLTVRGLPAAHHGHYEIWLYDSIIDSRALGRLRTGVRHVSLKLPPGSRHYRWIDISFQPLGYRNHSGESVLRAGDPARASRRQLRGRAARHRQLRRASNRSPSASSSK